MILALSLIALVVLVLVVVEMRDLLYAVIILAGADMVLALVFYLLAAPDIAITQAAVGAGLMTVVFVVTINKTERVECDSVSVMSRKVRLRRMEFLSHPHKGMKRCLQPKHEKEAGE